MTATRLYTVDAAVKAGADHELLIMPRRDGWRTQIVCRRKRCYSRTWRAGNDQMSLLQDRDTCGVLGLKKLPAALAEAGLANPGRWAVEIQNEGGDAIVRMVYPLPIVP
jgi:hypothetical protein